MEWKKTMRILPRLRFNNASTATNARILQIHSTKQEAMVTPFIKKCLLPVLNAGSSSLESPILMFTTMKSTSECKKPTIRKIEKPSALQLRTRNHRNGVEMKKSDKEIRAFKFAELMNKHFAASAILKGIQCLFLRLPSPEFLLLLCDNSYHYFVLESHNILAASVAVTYTGMHSWFALNPLSLAIVEVKGAHQFHCLTEENVPVLEAVENFHGIKNHYHGNYFASANLSETTPRKFASKLQATSPKYISILNHLRIYLSELFPNLDKVVFLDDDALVQRDLTPLEIDLVNGAVETCKGEDEWMMSNHFRNYFNFSHPLIANNLNPDECAWSYGMNVFDLCACKMTYIRDKYHSWLKEKLKLNLTMWKLVVIPPALIALRSHVHPIDPSWHLLGLGYLEKTSNKSMIHYKTASEYLKRQFLASRLHLCTSHTVLLLDLAFHVIRSVAVWSPFVKRIEVRLSNWRRDLLSKGADCSRSKAAFLYTLIKKI